MRDIHLSIVSHAQWQMVKELLADLECLDGFARLQLTIIHNMPGDKYTPNDDYSFPIKFIENKSPKGFGENHNFAFLNPPEIESRLYFFVLNPDLRIKDDVFSTLAAELDATLDVGVIAPIVMNVEGKVEDSARIIPTPWKIIKKVFGYTEHRCVLVQGVAYKPDWVAGMFLGFRSHVFEQIKGFNTHYFLYYEDVDICSRLWLSGLQVVVDPSVSIIHDAQRESHRNFKYLRWHLNSMLQFFLSGVFRQVYLFHKHRKELP